MRDALDLWFLKLALRNLTEDANTVRAEIDKIITRLVVAERQPPSLLGLPCGLRDQILHLLLVSSTEVRP